MRAEFSGALVVGTHESAVGDACRRLADESPIPLGIVSVTLPELRSPTWRRGRRLQRIARRVRLLVTQRRTTSPEELARKKLLVAIDAIAVDARPSTLLIALDDQVLNVVGAATRQRVGMSAVLGLDVGIRVFVVPIGLEPPAVDVVPPDPWGVGATTSSPRVRALIGGRNRDGVATRWAQDLDHLPGTRALSVARVDPTEPLTAPVDLPYGDARWALSDDRLQTITEQATHILVEGVGPWPIRATGSLDDDEAMRVLRRWAGRGQRVALVLDVLDLIDPENHAATYDWSAFLDHDQDTRAQGSQRVQRLRDSAMSSGLPVFVTESWVAGGLDGITVLPESIGARTEHLREPRSIADLPIFATWSARRDDPVVQLVDAKARLGQVVHHRLERVPPSMRSLIVSNVDVVIDRLGVGGLGWAGRLGLKWGRIVCAPGVGVDADFPVHHLYPDDATGPAPADTAATAADVLEELLVTAHDDPESLVAVAARGPETISNRAGSSAVIDALAGFVGIRD